MTVQSSELFLLDTTEYEIYGVFGTGLTSPRQLGLKPQAATTACWRGYVSTYGLRGRRLVLENLKVNLSTEADGYLPRPGPQINDVWPIQPEPPSADFPILFDNYYKGLGVPVPHTGDLVIVRDHVKELDWDDWMMPAWTFRVVVHMHFFWGILIRLRSWCRLAELMRSWSMRRGKRQWTR
jgi:hypothetical protein